MLQDHLEERALMEYFATGGQLGGWIKVNATYLHITESLPDRKTARRYQPAVLFNN
jgi:hypothetical protein